MVWSSFLRRLNCGAVDGKSARWLILLSWFVFSGVAGIFSGIRSVRAQTCQPGNEGVPSAEQACENDGCAMGMNNLGIRVVADWWNPC